ncbi:MAG: hypothetical protein ABIP95_00615 [Pelobium sp.]
MARVKNNIFLEGLSGKLYGLVFKTGKNGTFASKLPDRSNVQLSEKQKEGNQKFKEAVAYAKALLADPAQKATLLARTPKGRKPYHQALSEYLKSK